MPAAGRQHHADRGAVGRRDGRHLVRRRVRVRDAAGARGAHPVRRPGRHDPDPADRRDRAAVHPVQPPRLGGDLPAADRAQPVRQRVRDLPVPAVVPEPAAAPVRERGARGREPVPGVPPYRPPAGAPDRRRGRGLRVRRVVERLPRPAGLPPRAGHLHGQPRDGDLPGRPRQRRPLFGGDGPASRSCRRSSCSSSPSGSSSAASRPAGGERDDAVPALRRAADPRSDARARGTA